MLRILLALGGTLLIGALVAFGRPTAPLPAPPRPTDASSRARASDAIGPASPSVPPPSPRLPPSGPVASEKTFDTEGVQARAFDDTVDVQPMPRPGGSDWLANHEEPGQTYEEWRVCRRNVPNERRSSIRLVRLGALGEGDFPSVETLASYAETFFGLPARPVEDAVAAPTFTSRTNSGTGKPQILSTDVLDWLRREMPADAFCAVALTTTDLYPEDSWNYVFGQASFFDRTGVFSFARYDPAFFGRPREADTPALVLRRSLKVMSHEIGHMFGMEHCIRFRCLMNGSNNLAETDGTPIDLCPVCLRKLQHAARFDVLARERALEAWWRSHDLVPEADRAAARVTRWTAPGAAAPAVR